MASVKVSTTSASRTSKVSKNTKSALSTNDEGEKIFWHVLPPVQRATLLFVREYIQQNGFAPTLKEIALHLGVRSPSTAHFHLERLFEKGYLQRDSDGSLLLTEINVCNGSSANYVPLLGSVAAGIPLEAIENPVTIEIPYRFTANNGSVFCLEVSGDSMVDAHICDGDIVIVKQQNHADNGDIVVALLEDGSATLKTFRRLKTGQVMLIPANRELEERKILQPLTLDSVTIQGRVIGVIREM